MSQNNPIASVIILGYNSIPYIDECLSSVLDQNMPLKDYEILYADNASTDDSADHVTDNYPEVQVLRFHRNYGFAEGNNRAATYARGRYLIFLNQDTMAHKRWLSELITAKQRNPQFGACYSHQITPLVPEFARKDLDALMEHTYVPVLSPFGYMEARVLPFMETPVPTLFLSGATVMIERKVLDELDYLFDTDYFMWAEDLDLGLRLYARGYQVAMIPTSILYHDAGTGFYSQDKAPAYNLDAAQKAIHILRNRFITYYKNMYTLEFLLYLPFMLLGGPLKARRIPWGWMYRLVGIAAMVPAAVYAFLKSVKDFNHFREKRSRILSHRKTGRFWLMKALLTRYPTLPGENL